MSKTIRVIDLLNKIANGEDVPKEIKFEGVDFNLEEETYYAPNTMYSLIDYIKLKRLNLNEELEIIEEQEDIDIQEIVEPLEVESYECDKTDIRINRETIKKLVQAVKQLDKKIKEK